MSGYPKTAMRYKQYVISSVAEMLGAFEGAC